MTSLIEKSASPNIHPDIDIMKKEERIENKNFPPSAHCSFTSLLHSYKGRYMTPILVTFEPGGEKEFSHDGEEFVYVLSGVVTLSYENEHFNLVRGIVFISTQEKNTISKTMKNSKCSSFRVLQLPEVLMLLILIRFLPASPRIVPKIPHQDQCCCLCFLKAVV